MGSCSRSAQVLPQLIHQFVNVLLELDHIQLLILDTESGFDLGSHIWAGQDTRIGCLRFIVNALDLAADADFFNFIGYTAKLSVT